MPSATEPGKSRAGFRAPAAVRDTTRDPTVPGMARGAPRSWEGAGMMGSALQGRILHPQHRVLPISLTKIPAGIGGSSQISRKTSHLHLNHLEGFFGSR